MNYEQFIKGLFKFPGWVIERTNINSHAAIIRLRLDERYCFKCPYCSGKTGLNRILKQTVKDLPLGEIKLVNIEYEARQSYCNNCNKYSTFLPDGIDNRAKATKRLMIYVSRLCRFMPCNRIPLFVPISVATAQRWDKKILVEQLADPNFDNVRVIIVDEKSIGKNHNYLTVVINGESGEVLHLAEGKKAASLNSFFDKLTVKQIENIEVAGIDRGGAYKSSIKKRAPKTKIVYDKFHLIFNFNKVIDIVRRTEQNKLEKGEKDFIKGQRYNLFRRPENRTEEQQSELNILFEKNKPLFETDLLKDALQYLWTYRYTKSADKYLDRWIGWANETAIKPVIKFAKGLNRDRKEILNYIKYRVTSAKIEAFNNVIDRIVRRACGYQDIEYLFLKIRQERS